MFRTALKLFVNSLILLGLLLTGSASLHAKTKVIVAPISGVSQYPDIVKGLRYVLISDLRNSGQVEVLSDRSLGSVLDWQGNVSIDIDEISKKIYANVLVMLHLREDNEDFTLWVRAYELKNGYNIGSEILKGEYQAIKPFQNVLSEAVFRFLYISLSSEDLGEMSKGHTNNTAALKNYGDAYQSWEKGDYLDATKDFEKAAQIDGDFGLAASYTQTASKTTVKRSRNNYDRGKALELIGKFKEAYNEYDKVLKKDPKNSKALVGQGRILMLQGKRTESINKFRQAIQSDPNNPEIRIEAAKASLKWNKPMVAYAELKKAKQLGANSFELHDGLAKVYALQGKKNLAGREYLSAAKFLEKGLDFEKAKQYYRRASNAAKSVEAMQREAEIYVKQREYRVAITLLTKALFIDSSRSSIHSDLGKIFFMMGQNSKAFNKFRKAYDLNNQNYDANLYLGRIYLNVRDDAKSATSYLKNAIKIDPSRREAYEYLSRVYEDSNQINNAILLMTDFIRLKPNKAELYKTRGDLYIKAEDYERAIDDYNKAIDLRSDYVAALESLALAYKQAGQNKEILEVLKKLYSIDASNNIFVKGEVDILGGLTKGEFVSYVRTFPKTYETAFVDKVWINNVAATQIRPYRWGVDGILEMARPYRLDYSRIKRDIEIALYSQYRLINRESVGSVLQKGVSEDLFDQNDLFLAMSDSSSIDGVFGFKVSNYRKSKVTSELGVDLYLVTTADPKRFGHDKAMPVKYLTKDIFVFNPLCLLVYLVALLVVGSPLFYLTFYRSWVRGRGKLIVRINYDAKNESFLTLRLSTKEIKEREKLIEIVRDKQKHQKEKYRRHLRQRGTFVKNMVGKETVFNKVPAGKIYFVYLYGTIEDTQLKQTTVGNYSLLQKVRIEKDKTKEIFFQLEKEEAFVRVFVTKGEEELTGVELKVQGQEQLKYSKAGVGAFFDLKVGRHSLKISHDGQIYTREIEITNLDDKDIWINLEEDELAQQADANYEAVAEQLKNAGDLEGAAELYRKHGDARAKELEEEVYTKHNVDDTAAEMFKKQKEFKKAGDVYAQLGDSAKANQMYGLHYFNTGDFEKAYEALKDSNHYRVLAKIFEKMGKKDEMHEHLALHYMDQGQHVEAAMEFANAKKYAQAGELYEKVGDLQKAAFMHAKDNNYALVGELFARAGDKRRAAVAFEKANQYDSALIFYRELGEKNKVAELLVKQNKFLEAAKEYREQGLLDEAIKICQDTPPDHQDAFGVTALLGSLFAKKGIEDMAIKSYDKIFSKDPKLMDSEYLYEYGTLLEKSGGFKKALSAYEILMQRDLNFKDTAQKVKSVKTKVSQEQKMEQAKATVAAEKAPGASQPARYEMIEELGRGAMGIVYKAKDTLLDRIVAYKTLPSAVQNDQGALDSLIKEAKTAAQLSHPNIVTVFDVGQVNGSYYITMEYVQGRTLQQVLQKIRRVNLENFINVAMPLCDVLSYAHSKKVIHRDVKPSNVILFPKKGVKLMDFGIAKVLQEGGKDQTLMRGTPLYMAPEQIMGKGIDHRTDIYALGITFYEMLSGTPPFTEGDVMYAHVHNQPRAIDEIINGLDPNLSGLIMRCIAKNKEERFNSVDEIKIMLSKVQF